MECACVYVDVWDGEGCMVLKAVERKARVPHRCGECQREICPGERYQDERILDDSGVCTLKTCADCMSLRNSVFCNCWIYGELWNDFSQHLRGLCDEDDVPWTKIGELTPAARDRALDMVEKYVFTRCEEEDKNGDA